MKEYAIIVAGGVGSRMGAEIPKQFLLIDGVPIIIQTIRKFISYNQEIEIILVLPADHLEKWDELKNEFFPQRSIEVTQGGASRSASVVSGLSLIGDDGLVAIHDAVRPFVSEKIIAQSFQSASSNGSGVAAVAMKDSIRELTSNDSSKARNREDFVLVQTPQTFLASQLKEAYHKAAGNVFTDDATVFENAGFQVHLVGGCYTNIKITTPEDLK